MFTPSSRAYVGSSACSASMNAAMPPFACASAIMCRQTVVLPEPSGPKTSMIRPRGMPPTPSAMSSASEPDGMTVMPAPIGCSPSFMTAPLPNCFSICCSVTSSIFSRSIALSSLCPLGSPVRRIRRRSSPIAETLPSGSDISYTPVIRRVQRHRRAKATRTDVRTQAPGLILRARTLRRGSYVGAATVGGGSGTGRPGRRRTAPTRAPCPAKALRQTEGRLGTRHRQVRVERAAPRGGTLPRARVSRSATSPVRTPAGSSTPPRGPGPAVSTGTLRGRAASQRGRRVRAGDRSDGLLDPRRQASGRARRGTSASRASSPAGSSVRSGTHSRHGSTAALTASTPARAPRRRGTAVAPGPRRLDRVLRHRSLRGPIARQRHALEVPPDQVQARLLRPAPDAEPFARGTRTRARAAHPSASSAIHTVPGSAPPCGSGPAAPVSARPTPAPNTRRAPAAISRAHASLTTPGPSIVSCDTPRTLRFASAV